MQLENASFRISRDEERGGKITAIFDYRIGRNLLAADAVPACLTLEGGAQFAVAGWDEAFPTLEPDGEFPTLGLAWRMRGDYEVVEDALLSRSSIPPWHLERAVRMHDDMINADYAITNNDALPTRMLWAAHALYPLAGLQLVELPYGELHPGPGCRLEELRTRLTQAAYSWHVRHLEACGKSWKFFLPATSAVIMHYADARLTLTTTAPWWGIWLNLGALGSGCLGIEPTNAPTDSLSKVSNPVAGHGTYTVSWTLQVQPLTRSEVSA